MADSIIQIEAEALEYIGFDYAAVEGDISAKAAKRHLRRKLQRIIEE